LELQASVSHAVAVVDQGTASFSLAQDGTVCALTFDAPRLGSLPLACRAPFTGGTPTHLRTVSGESGFIAWNDTQLWWLPSVDTAAFGPFSATAVDGGTALFRDVLGFAPPGLPGYRALLGIGDDALYVARIDDSGLVTNPSGAMAPLFD